MRDDFHVLDVSHMCNRSTLEPKSTITAAWRAWNRCSLKDWSRRLCKPQTRFRLNAASEPALISQTAATNRYMCVNAWHCKDTVGMLIYTSHCGSLTHTSHSTCNRFPLSGPEAQSKTKPQGDNAPASCAATRRECDSCGSTHTTSGEVKAPRQ